MDAIYMYLTTPTHLQLDDGPALIFGYPDGRQVLETDESVGQVGETIAHHV